MQFKKLGNTDLDVSLICLGTMTYGEQNTESEAHEQLDYAIENGVNFLDMAEMYPVPPRAETQGRTEAYIGSWLKQRGNRDDVVIATKIAGPSADWLPHIRGGSRFTASHIDQAVESSLKRIGTDYIDLYQLHWPDRNTNYFGKLGYEHQEIDETPLEETLVALKKHVDAGNIRYIGLSNETPWGFSKCLELAKYHNLPRVMSVQNPYNLLNRTYEVGMAEISIREQAGLLAYSPLAFGALSGKYLNDQWPEGARMTLFKRFSRYFTPSGIKATQAYVDLAKAHQLDPSQMALAYVNSRPFTTANIIGATSLSQLKDNIDSVNISLSDELIEGIDAIHKDIANPCP